MKVGELIEILKKHPTNTKVILDGGEGGFDDIKHHRIIKIGLRDSFKADWNWYGDYDLLEDIDKDELEKNTIGEALLLTRYSED